LDKSIAENEEYQFNSLPSKTGFSRLFATWKNKVGSLVLKSGNKLKIVGARCCNGCMWVQNCKRMIQAFWKGDVDWDVKLHSQVDN
jgi:hypothetical protein